MSSMRFNAHLDTSHHGQKHHFKDAGAVADSLTPIQRCASSLSTGAAYKRVSRFSLGKIPEDSSQVSVEATQWVLLYLPIGHHRSCWEISHSAAQICRSTIAHAPDSNFCWHPFSYSSQIKYFRTNVDMDTSCIVMWISWPKLVPNFQLRPLYTRRSLSWEQPVQTKALQLQRCQQATNHSFTKPDIGLLTHGAEPFLRRIQICSYSRIS
jgi:hypothetical protein